MGRVAIAGAGPTGACLALLLAERGVDVVLIEASRSFQRQFRGQALMPSGLDALRQMGLSDLLSTAVEELSPGIPTTALAAWEFWIEGKRLFRVAEPMEASGPPCTLVSQPEFLQAVVDRAQTCPRFEFVSGQAVKSLNWQGDRVTGLTLANGQAIAADLVIAADGRNSSLREAAQLVLKQPKKAIDVLWFSLPDAPVLRGENVFYAIVDQGNAFGLFRNAQGAAQLGWGLPDAGAIAWQAMDWQQTILQHSPPWLAEALTQYLTTHSSAFQHPRLFSVTVGIAPHWSRPGLLLLGDAAHPMSPIRAQGINMALRDSIVAANHLVPVLGGNGIDGDTTEISRFPKILYAQLNWMLP